MMDAMKVAAALRRAAENAGCVTHAVISGSWLCPDCKCGECMERSRAWFREAADAVERCALPEGVEWPRYESGEPVRFDDCVENRYGTCTVNSVRFYKGGGVTVYGEDVGAQFVVVTEPVMHEPIRKARQKVLAADGEPLEVGQTVWGLDGFEYVVCEVFQQKVAVEFLRDGIAAHGSIAPWLLTHQRPVLDADGVPIKVGDTVYGTVEGGPFIVTEVSDKGSVFVDAFPDTGMHGSMFTHAKPEPPDSWERLDEDAEKNPFDYCKDVGHRLDTCENAERFKSRDLVRRCRALVERGER